MKRANERLMVPGAMWTETIMGPEAAPPTTLRGRNLLFARLAWSSWALTLVLVVLAALLSFHAPEIPERSQSPGAMIILHSLLILTFPTVGAIVVSRRPENPLGLIFCGAGLVIAFQGFALGYADYALFVRPGSLPGVEIMAWISSWIGMPVLVLAVTLLFLLFPNGRLPSRRWRFVIWMVAVGSVMVAIGMALRPGPLETHSSVDNPAGIGGAIGDVLWVVSVAGAMLLNVGWISSGVSLIVRWRRASGVERQQIKWFAYAAVLMAGGFAASLVFSSSRISSVAWFLFILGFMILPIATGVAILRYRLYDIDIIINRTLVYGALTAMLAAVYFGSVVLLRGTLFGFTVDSADWSSHLTVIASTLLVVVLFQPLRDRLQRAVNRMMYGERDEPYKVLSRLGQRLEAALAPEAVLATVVKAVAEALKLPYAAVELERDGMFEVAAATGDPVKDPLRLPLLYGGEPVGRLVLGRRAGEEEFSAADRRLLEDLARQVGVAVHATRLTDEALKLSADLQRSRERLVTAREEERRRLRRDLHDGLGPQLASLTMKAEAARDLLAVDPARSEALLEDITAQTQEAVTDVRRLVYGLRPPALDDLGLLGVLRTQAAHGDHNGLRVTVEAPTELPPLPAAVEVAAYRIVQEAVTNAARHAGARNCTVRIAPDEEANVLRLEIEDDGRGIPEDRSAGVGLASMRERAEELGGSCAVEAMPEGGTRVEAVLPLAHSSREGEVVEPALRKE